MRCQPGTSSSVQLELRPHASAEGRPSHASEDRAGRECSAVDTPGYPESLHCPGDCTAHRRSSTVEQRHMKGRTRERWKRDNIESRIFFAIKARQYFQRPSPCPGFLELTLGFSSASKVLMARLHFQRTGRAKPSHGQLARTRCYLFPLQTTMIFGHTSFHFGERSSTLSRIRIFAVIPYDSCTDHHLFVHPASRGVSAMEGLGCGPGTRFN